MNIDYSCPQCGAPIVLNETDRILTCPYCRVRHSLVPEGLFRYYLPPDPRLADPDRILFVPYGRFRGMFFHLLGPAMESKVVDHNFLALKDIFFPSSLGLRPQTLHLRPALFNQGEKCLTADQNIFDFHSRKSAIKDRAYLGEVKSIIYAPFYRQSSSWFDAVLNQPVQTAEEGVLTPQHPTDIHYSWKVSFLPVLCPDCGWDLAAENESCILFCPQCDSGWEPDGRGFKKIGYEVIKAPGTPEGLFYLPFWRFTPLPGTKVYKVLELERPASDYWLPAFKIAPRLFMLLGKRMTQAQIASPTVELPRLPNSFHPVTLPAEEAREAVPLICSSFTRDPEALPELTLDPLAEECRTDLLFIPFLWTSLELVQPQIKLGVSRSALDLAKYI
jgi:uncharacterized CHY-type Zn-finger protein